METSHPESGSSGDLLPSSRSARALNSQNLPDDFTKADTQREALDTGSRSLSEIVSKINHLKSWHLAIKLDHTREEPVLRSEEDFWNAYNQGSTVPGEPHIIIGLLTVWQRLKEGTGSDPMLERIWKPDDRNSQSS